MNLKINLMHCRGRKLKSKMGSVAPNMRRKFIMIKTGFRRFDIFLADMSQFNIENHYVCIVSNYKNNIKADSCNCIMISSKLKKLPSHVDFEGFGLTEPSQVKCEKIYTLLKTDLIKKVGNIDNLNLQLKIEKALAQQLQIDVSYNNFNAFDLENLFVENNSKVENEKVKLEKAKSKLYSSYRNKEYKESITLASELKELALNSKYVGKVEFIWYSVYMHSLVNLDLLNLEEAYISAQECMTYINRPDGYDKNYSLSLWLLGSISEKMHDIVKSTTIFKALSRYYKNNYENLMRSASVYNIAKSKNDLKAMKNIYTILENMECTDRSIYNKEEYKQELLLEMRTDISAF